MLIIALVLAVIGLAALVFAVVTSNELVAWVCIGASVLGVVLLIIDALRERQRREAGTATKESAATERHDSHAGEAAADYPAEALDERDEPSAAADSESDAEAADSVSDDHNTR
jgi:heme exporter protein D